MIIDEYANTQKFSDFSRNAEKIIQDAVWNYNGENGQFDTVYDSLYDSIGLEIKDINLVDVNIINQK